MLSCVALCVVALATTASANFTANLFIDQVLNEMRFQVSQNALDPFYVLPFDIKVKSNGIGNRDLKAIFSQGTLTGLAMLGRRGDCSYGTFGLGMKLGCYISLRPIGVSLNGIVKGDWIFGAMHSITTSTSLGADSYALIEVQGARGRQAVLDRVTVKPLTMNTFVTRGRLDLNKSRLDDFVKHIHAEITRQLDITLRGTYSSVLATVVSRHFMP